DLGQLVVRARQSWVMSVLPMAKDGLSTTILDNVTELPVTRSSIGVTRRVGEWNE
ncbi:hypothetical protein PM082_004133, partial [Marasmius tenuissimus]